MARTAMKVGNYEREIRGKCKGKERVCVSTVPFMQDQHCERNDGNVIASTSSNSSRENMANMTVVIQVLETGQM